MATISIDRHEIKIGDTISARKRIDKKYDIYLTRHVDGKVVFKSNPQIFHGNIEEVKKAIRLVADLLGVMAYASSEDKEEGHYIYELTS